MGKMQAANKKFGQRQSLNRSRKRSRSRRSIWSMLELLERRTMFDTAGILTIDGALVDHAAHDHAEMPAPYTPPGVFLTSPTGALTGPSTDSPLAIAIDFLQDHAEQFGVTAADVAAPLVTNLYTDATTGITHVYFAQVFDGLEIANADANVNIAADGRVLSAGSSFADLPTSLPTSFTSIMPASEALRLAGLSLDLAPYGPVDIAAAATLTSSVIVDPGSSLDPITAKPQYVVTEAGFNLVWSFVLRTPDGDHWYDTSVDAYSGANLWTEDWVDHATYNVFAQPTESPLDGPRSIVTDPHDPTASPFGWHDTNGVPGAEFTDTRGNNVSAQEDIDANNSGGTRPDGGAGLNFDFPLDLTQAPSTYRPAAITNLFYWNNLLHDVHYAYGFTEVAGNFQTLNYTGTGLGNDAVQADAQDGAGTNNANFATPPDGSVPRMQMYVFTAANPDRDGDLENPIIIHEYGHGVSNRITGGPSNSNALSALQSGGMGEGWGDWWSLMLTMKPTDTKLGRYPVGNWVINQTASGAGIRRFPYSYDMAIDPLTLGSFNSSNEVHDAGEIWCSVLWDMAWNLIDKHGYTNDYTHGYNAADPLRNGGNNLALRLVMDALKLQPANPSFIQARNAIIQADVNLTGGANAQEIWAAFARRGFGFSASSGSSSSSTTVTQAFDLPPGLQSGRVTSQTPTGISTSLINQVELNFNRAMDAGSFSIVDDVASFTGPGAVDLKPTITGFTWVDADTLRIEFPALSADGAYALVVGPQILDGTNHNPMDQDADGVTGEAIADRYTANFRYDSLLMQVVSTVPASGSTVALPLSAVEVNFNEPYDPASIAASDLVLNQGSVTGFALVDADTVQFNLSGISGETTLNLSIAVGAISDLFGNPNAAFAGSLTLDVGTVPFPVPLSAVSPPGSLVYQSSANTNISLDTDVDSFTLALDAGQKITIVADPAATLRPILELFDASSVFVAGVAAEAAGQDTLLQTITVPSAGTYTITLRAVAGSLGTASVRVVLNAALEVENHNGTANNSAAAAQNLDPSSLPLAGSAGRASVLGKGDAAGDYYSISLAAGDHNLIAAYGGATGLELRDSTDAVVALGLLDSAAGRWVLPDFVAPASATYFVRVLAPTNADYNLVVAKNVILDVELNDTSATAQDISTTGAVIGSAGRAGSGRLFEYDGGQIREVNLQTGAIIRSFASPVAIGGSDFGLATTANSILAASLSTAEIFEIDPDTGATIRTIPKPNVGASGLAFMNNEIYMLTDAPAGQISVIDYTTGALLRTINSSGVVERLGSDGTKLYTTIGATLIEINPLTGAQTNVGTLTGTTSSSAGLGFVGNEIFTSVTTTMRVYNRSTLALARTFTGFGTMEAIGADGGSKDEDWFRVEVLAGANLIASTSTPADGAGEFVNMFNPKLEIYDPSGALAASDDNSAPDGRNALLSHVALVAGTYRVRVLSPDGSGIGDYVLQVQGATAVPAPFTATAGSPASGSLLGVAPTTVRIDFNDAYYRPSLEPGDLLIDGVPATGVTFDDADTATFSVAALGHGPHTITIAAGAVLDLQQTGLATFTSSFTLDLVAPRIIGSSIQQGDVLPAGSIVFTVTFDEPMNVANLDNVDFSLQGAIGGAFIPQTRSFNAAGTVLTMNFSNPLPEDQYTLTLHSGNTNFEDPLGNDLDGEPLAFPLPPNSSGNGTAGGNFVLNFSLDAGAMPFPVPLAAQVPVGSLIYSGIALNKLVNSASDVDTWTLSLDAGQTITIAVDPVAGLQPIIELFDPSSILVGSATAAAAGSDAVLQNLTVSTAGIYTIALRSAAGLGVAGVQVVLNAAVEMEGHNGPTNDTRATAQSLDALFVNLGGGKSRAAVVGVAEAFISDFYTITLAAGEILNIAVSGSSGLELQDATGTVLAFGGTSATNVDRSIRNFVVVTPGVYYVRVSPASGASYRLLVMRNLDFEAELNDTAATAQNISATGTVIGSAGGVGSGRLFEYDGNQIREVNPQTGAHIRSFASPVALGGADFGLATTPTSILAAGLSSAAIFEINPDTGATIRTIPKPSVNASGLAFMNNEIYLLTDSPGGQITVINYDTGAVIRTITATSVSEELSSDGTKLYSVNGTTLVEINPLTGATTNVGTLASSSNAEGLGFVGNEIFVSVTSTLRVYNRNTLALVRTFTGFGSMEALGADGGLKDEDWFQVNVPVGRTIVVSTSTPGGGSGEFVNTFDPRIELYDAGGTLLASDDNSASDGRNAQLSRANLAAGNYRIRVLSSAATAGEYLLNVGAFLAADFDADGDVDGADFVVWQANFPLASGATPAQGDADGDGDVDGADFVVWQTSFPTVSSPGFAAPVSGSASAVSLPSAEESRPEIASSAGDQKSTLVSDRSNASAASLFASMTSNAQSFLASRAAEAADYIAPPARSSLSPAGVDYWLQSSTMYRSRSAGRIAAPPASVLADRLPRIV